MPTAARFSRTQIILHWLIAAMVIFQIVAHEGIQDAWRARLRGTEVSLINPHAIIGILILLLTIWRLTVRLRHGAPPPPAGEHPALQWISRATHLTFYALLFIMPLSGVAMWGFEIREARFVHEYARLVFIALILLHTAAALAHQFWFKTNVLQRMLGRA